MKYGNRLRNIGSKGKGLHLAKKADDKIFYCVDCRICFEYDYLSKQTLYYDNFPSYGKKRKNCPKCSKKEASQNEMLHSASV